MVNTSKNDIDPLPPLVSWIVHVVHGDLTSTKHLLSVHEAHEASCLQCDTHVGFTFKALSFSYLLT